MDMRGGGESHLASLSPRRTRSVRRFYSWSGPTPRLRLPRCHVPATGWCEPVRASPSARCREVVRVRGSRCRRCAYATRDGIESVDDDRTPPTTTTPPTQLIVDATPRVSPGSPPPPTVRRFRSSDLRPRSSAIDPRVDRTDGSECRIGMSDPCRDAPRGTSGSGSRRAKTPSRRGIGSNCDKRRSIDRLRSSSISSLPLSSIFIVAGERRWKTFLLSSHFERNSLARNFTNNYGRRDKLCSRARLSGVLCSSVFRVR